MPNLMAMIGKRMGENQQQGRQQQQKSEQELKAEIYKMMIKEKIKSQMMKDQMIAYKDLVGSGNFKVSMGPSGFTFNPISPDEQLKNLEAQETLSQAGYGGKQQPSTPSPQLPFPSNLSTPTGARMFGGQPPQLPGGQPPQFPGGQPPRIPTQRLQATSQPQAFGGGLLGLKAQQDAMKERTTAQIKSETQAKAGKKMGRVNVNIVGGAFERLAQTFADASKEGATGDIYRQTFAKNIALGGVVPKNWGGKELQQKFRRTAAYEGQKTEVITKMMPMLTQQGDKPGSVRLIRSIFDRLSKTIPELKHGNEPAMEMIKESMKNMYGFAAAVENAGGMNNFVTQIGYSPNSLSVLNKQQRDILASSIVDGIQQGELGISIGLTPSQEQEINRVIERVLAPISALGQGQSGYRVIRQVR